MCHLRSADLQPQGLIKLQFWDRLCIRTREVRPLIMTRFRRKVCRLVKPYPLHLSSRFFVPFCPSSQTLPPSPLIRLNHG